jgi:FKBP-type peptidyl-prolyl cis-trans isomerase SlyD
LVGRARGEQFSVVVPAAQGFGERKSKGAQAVPRNEFPRGLNLEPGVQFKARGASGKEALLWVVKVIGSKVWVDTDHPLAGVDLHFEAEVLDFRDPTMEELSHGHAHGAHGHDAHG